MSTAGKSEGSPLKKRTPLGGERVGDSGMNFPLAGDKIHDLPFQESGKGGATHP